MEINLPREENIYRFHSRTSPPSRTDGSQGQTLVVILEMTNQSDEILRILSDYGRSMKKRELRRQTGLMMYEIAPILEDLERESKIRIDSNYVVSMV